MNKTGIITYLIGILFMAALVTNTAAASETSGDNTADNWVIDRELRFHYAVSPINELLLSGEKCITPSIAPFSVEYKPDITNIILKNILGLGFPLPTREDPENYNYYLKFYEFPYVIDPVVTSKRVLTPYMLYKMKGGKRIESYVSKRENLYVKLGYVDKKDAVYTMEKPCPNLRVPVTSLRRDENVFSPQAIFDGQIPFSSIYIGYKEKMPANISDVEKARWTQKGLLSFYGELLKIYEKNLIEVKGVESDKYRYFLDMNYDVEGSLRLKSFTLIKLPKKPLLFDNVRDLPMPHDPDRIFLSGLLIVYRTEYARTGKLPKEILIGSPEFNENFKEKAKDLLEVVSVVKLD